MPYVIYCSKEHGGYSTGSKSPRFVAFPRAKVWKTLGQVKNHLAQFKTFQGVNLVPKDWVVIQVELKLTDQVQDAHDLAQEGAEKTAKRQAQYTDKWDQRKAEQEMAELKRLQKKYQSAIPWGFE